MIWRNNNAFWLIIELELVANETNLYCNRPTTYRLSTVLTIVKTTDVDIRKMALKLNICHLFVV